MRLVFINLKKRLLSSIPANLRSLGKHAQSFDLVLGPALIAAVAQQSIEYTDDDEVDPGDEQLDEADDDAVSTGSRELATPSAAPAILALHIDLDRAVLHAYGWDVSP